MMQSSAKAETEIDLGDDGDSEDSEGRQLWKTQLETVMEEEEEEEDVVSTQSDTRPLLNERDPRQINECLKVSFEDVIAEPESVRSGDRVWIWSHALFEVSRVWFYRIITALLAVPVSIIAGILFAVLSCVHIWYVLLSTDRLALLLLSTDQLALLLLSTDWLLSPCVKVMLINTGWLETLWSSVLDILLLPFFQSVAKCCGSVGVRLTRQ
ncbi:hypothetical protein NFI96_012560 [Prochilodus magdalenae]|nr:hypothetical protein NFI96_012560 [Prochilodus magdalenae]